MPAIEFLVDRKDAGETIATVLRKRFNLPWSQVKRVIERGHVRVAGFACSDPGHRVKAKNRVWIREGVIELPKSRGQAEKPRDKSGPAPSRTRPGGTPRATPRPTPGSNEQRVRSGDGPPPQMPLSPSELVYVDDDVVVVNKPAGLTTMRHAEEASEFGERGRTFLPKTLADYLPHLLGTPTARVIPVHRIDRDTSGLVVFARTRAAAEHLTGQFRKHTVDRRYLALVRGTPPEGRIESRFVRDRGDGRRGSSPDPAGKRAVTHVKRLEQFDGYALVECRLETGRTHQVRIHLGEAGAPLCGERVYDRPLNGTPAPDGSGAARPMLHAARLGFVHPQTGQVMRREVDPPPDFARLLQTLRKRGPGPGH